MSRWKRNMGNSRGRSFSFSVLHWQTFKVDSVLLAPHFLRPFLPPVRSFQKVFVILPVCATQNSRSGVLESSPF